MNIDEFIDKLAKMRDRKKWRLTPCGSIRSDDECPITSFKDAGCLQVVKIAEQLELNSEDVSMIVYAADNYDKLPRTIAMREKLLIATGLK